jgi:hypothetical protein
MSNDDDYRVSDYNPETWPDDIVLALAGWKQGDLVPGQNFSWLSISGDAVTGQSSTEDLGAVELGAKQSGWLVVASQTCDIMGTGTGSHQPFVQVCPVLDMTSEDESRKTEIRNFRIGYLVPISHLSDSGRFMTADLRLSMPLSKAALARLANAGSAFGTEEERLNFAEAIAIRFRRPALHDALSEGLIKAFSGHFKGQKKLNRQPATKNAGSVSPAPAPAAPRRTETARRWLDSARRAARASLVRVGVAAPQPADRMPAQDSAPGESWWREVDHVRLIIHGERLRPTSVQLLVVTCRDFGETEKKPWWEFAGPARSALKPAGIQYEETVLFQTLDQLSARIFKNSVPIRFAELGQPPTF